MTALARAILPVLWLYERSVAIHVRQIGVSAAAAANQDAPRLDPRDRRFWVRFCPVRHSPRPSFWYLVDHFPDRLKVFLQGLGDPRASYPSSALGLRIGVVSILIQY